MDNFSFLSNLQVIEGHYNRDAPVSLAIYNTNINFLGLINLKAIGLKGLKNKQIDIRNNTNLCYFDIEKFRKVLNFSDSIYAVNLKDPQLCRKFLLCARFVNVSSWNNNNKLHFIICSLTSSMKYFCMISLNCHFNRAKFIENFVWLFRRHFVLIECNINSILTVYFCDVAYCDVSLRHMKNNS